MSFPRVSPTEPLDPRFFSRSSPSFLGSRSMVSFEDANAVNSTKRPFFSSFNQDEVVAGDEYEEYLAQPEKKRRLTADQIQFLEKSFETDNKLEPERKVQLAKDLGLQPRQVAIWFQNRRARWKNKQMEKDYDVLLSSYNSLKADYERILNEKEKLSAEVLDLNDKLGLQKKDLDQSDKEQPPKLSSPQGPTDESASEDEASKNQAEAYKLEDTSSKAIDSDSSNYIDVGHFSFLEAGKTSYVLEPEHSDLSQDEEDNLNKNMVSPSVYVFPKMEDDEPAFSCYYEFPVEDQALEFWHY